MLDLLDDVLNRATMYKAMQYYLRALVFVAVVAGFFHFLPYSWWQLLATILYLTIICGVINQGFAWLFKIRPNFESQFISGLILTLILGPVNPFILSNLLFLTFAAFAAMGSKYILAINGRHIFNPAAFGALAVTLILKQGASWWIGNPIMLAFVILGGLIMARKLKWFHLIWSFLLTYAVLISGVSFFQGFSLHELLSLLKSLAFYSPIFFFSFVMLTEPLTSPPTKKRRIHFGIFVAIILVVFQTFLTRIGYTLELSLLAGNIFAFILNPVSNIKLKLKEKLEVATNTLAFTFLPSKNFSFKPGQYLFYSLPHPKADSRGSRRYFTIASSPTENQIMLASRMAEKSSSLKQTLKNLKAEDEVRALALDGEFTLPKNLSQPLIFIAGGIGITPFRSMIKFLMDKKTKQPITLLYSNKTTNEIAFKDLLDQAEKAIGLKTVYAITEQTGYIDEKMIKREVPNLAENLFYISGPDPFVRAIKKTLLSLSVSRNKIKTDFFPGYE